MKKIISLLLSIVAIATLFTACANNNTPEEKYSISYYGVLDGEKIDLPAIAYENNVVYPQEYVKGEITVVENLKRYYVSTIDGINYDISFDGWFLDQACTQECNFISKNSTGDLVFYAKLTAREIRTEFTITYKAVINGNIAEIPANMFNIEGQYPNSYYGGGVVVVSDLLKNYKPNNDSEYTFVGWYLTSDCNEEFTGIDDSTRGSLTLYAKINYFIWTPNV